MTPRRLAAFAVAVVAILFAIAASLHPGPEEWVAIVTGVLAFVTFLLALGTASLAKETQALVRDTGVEVVASRQQAEAATEQARSLARSLQADLRPVLVHAQREDTQDDLAVRPAGWVEWSERLDVYNRPTLALGLVARVRNAGNGLALLESIDTDPKEFIHDGVPLETLNVGDRDLRRSMRRRSHIRLTEDEYQAAVAALTNGASYGA